MFPRACATGSEVPSNISTLLETFLSANTSYQKQISLLLFYDSTQKRDKTVYGYRYTNRVIGRDRIIEFVTWTGLSIIIEI